MRGRNAEGNPFSTPQAGALPLDRSHSTDTSASARVERAKEARSRAETAALPASSNPIRTAVVDLDTAIQVATMMDKYQLAAMCSERDLQTPSRAPKNVLIRTLLTNIARSSGGGGGQGAQLDLANDLDGDMQMQGTSSARTQGGRDKRLAETCLAALKIFALRVADVPTSEEHDKLLSTLQISKMCLVGHECNRIFSHSSLHSWLDSSTLTRQGFMREMLRPEQVCMCACAHVCVRCVKESKRAHTANLTHAWFVSLAAAAVVADRRPRRLDVFKGAVPTDIASKNAGSYRY